MTIDTPDTTTAETLATPAAASGYVTPASVWKSRIGKCKTVKKKLVPEWGISIDYRRGKPFAHGSDEDRIAVSADWSATKAKQAQLYSLTPEVRLTAKDPTYDKVVPVFGKKLNETLTKARVGVAMDECLPDCINASGIGFALVNYEARMVDKVVPVGIDELTKAALLAAGKALPTEIVPTPTDKRITVTHVSPEDALWPVECSVSDFDDAPWLGHSGRLSWGVAKGAFKLTDTDKETVCKGDSRTSQEKLVQQAGDDDRDKEDVVAFDELFYHRYLEDPQETSFDAIWRIVFVEGKTEPVIHEAWKGQVKTPDNRIIGSCNGPMRALTLTYVSGDTIPPSDSAMARPQVDELMKGRSQMVRQREHSLPLRWFDVNRVSPEVQDTLMRGTWQGMIPMNGDGSRAIGEVARASYPSEDFEFNQITRQDLAECWQVAPNQSGSYSPRGISASEAQIAQANFSTRIGYERARVTKFFVGIAEVVAGLLALYGEFTPAEEEALSAWPRQELANYFVYSVWADSTVLLDASQRLERLTNFLNLTAKSGFVYPLSVIREMAILSGVNDIDGTVMVPPPPVPEPASISLRLTGAEDLNNPLLLAFLLKSGQAPTIPDIERAKALMAAASLPMQMVSPAGPDGGGEGDPGDPSGPGGPGDAGAPTGGPGLPSVPDLAGAHPNWSVMNRIDKRSARPGD